MLADDWFKNCHDHVAKELAKAKRQNQEGVMNLGLGTSAGIGE